MHFAWVPFGASYRFLLCLSFSCLLSSLAHHSGAVGTEAVSSTYAAMSVRYAALAVFLSVDVTTASELAAAVAVSTTGTTPTFVFHLATRPVHRFEGPDMEQLAAVLAQFASAVAAGAGNGGSVMGAGGGPGGPGMGGGGGGRPSKEERMAAVKANAVTFVTAVAMVRALPLVRSGLGGAAAGWVSGVRRGPAVFREGRSFGLVGGLRRELACGVLCSRC